MWRSVLLLTLSWVILSQGFTLDTTTVDSVDSTKEIDKPDVIDLNLNVKESNFYDSLELSFKGVIVDSLFIDFDLFLLCSDKPTKVEIWGRRKEVGAFLRSIMLEAEATSFSVKPYEKRVLKEVNKMLKTGSVKKAQLRQTNIY